MYIFLKLLNCSVLRFLFKTILFDRLTPRIRNKYRSGKWLRVNLATSSIVIELFVRVGLALVA